MAPLPAIILFQDLKNRLLTFQEKLLTKIIIVICMHAVLLSMQHSITLMQTLHVQFRHFAVFCITFKYIIMLHSFPYDIHNTYKTFSIFFVLLSLLSELGNQSK